MLLESDLHVLQYSYQQCIDTTLIFHHPRRHPQKPVYTQVAQLHHIRLCELGGHNPEDDVGVCVDLLKANTKNSAHAAHPSRRLRNMV